LRWPIADGRGLAGWLRAVGPRCSLAAGHAFVQNLSRGHCELAAEVPLHYRLRVAFDQLAPAI
jgi:hypothetical protein